MKFTRMRIFIIGTHVESEESFELFSNYCQNLGKELGSKQIALIICSPFIKSVDFQIIKGSFENLQINANFEIYYPKHPSVEDKWNELLGTIVELDNLKIKKFRFAAPENESEEIWRYSWLFCQLQAIQNANIIISIGGKLDAAANLLLRIAESQNKIILPIPKFGGVAAHFYEKNKYSLIDTFGILNYDKLKNHKYANEIIELILESPNKNEVSGIINKKPIFFISYSRTRPSEADFIEMILRRRNFEVLRDETNITASNDIPNSIRENILKSDVFICLFCQEYACSPWCFDELSIVLEKKQKTQKAIWIFCLDETRIVHPKARRLLFYRVKSREEIEGKILNLLAELIK